MCNANNHEYHYLVVICGLVVALQNFSIENCDIHCTLPIIDCLFIDN